MKTQYIAALLAGTMAACIATPSIAEDAERSQDQAREEMQMRDRDIYGSQLMTPQERNEFRERMRAAKSAEERERIRQEHHEQMKARAQERGLTLPDEPPARPGGMGPGGMGPGGGGGGGMGPGGRR